MTGVELSVLVSCATGALGMLAVVSNTSRKVGSVLEDMAQNRSMLEEVRDDVKAMRNDLTTLQAEHSLMMTSGGCISTTSRRAK